MRIKDKESLRDFVLPDSGPNSNHTYRHVAVIMRGNKVLEYAGNMVGSRSRGCGYSNYTIHAERNVVKKLGDTNKLNGCNMYVFRLSIGSEKRIGFSEPCHDCKIFLTKCMNLYGLKKVYYTVND